MEENQIQHIERNWEELCMTTNCSFPLLSRLLQLGVIGFLDLPGLSISGLSTFNKSALLFDILFTRRGSYYALINALEFTKQYVPVQILRQYNMDVVTTFCYFEDQTQQVRQVAAQNSSPFNCTLHRSAEGNYGQTYSLQGQGNHLTTRQPIDLAIDRYGNVMYRVSGQFDPPQNLGQIRRAMVENHDGSSMIFNLGVDSTTSGCYLAPQPLSQNYGGSSRQIQQTTSFIENPNQPKESIQFTASEENVLGSGSGGTRVYLGKFGMRAVAVKQLTVFQNLKKAQREIAMLTQLDGHENVLRYFGWNWEEKSQSILLALELAQATLCSWTKNPNCISSPIDRRNVLLQTTTGLQYLHIKNVIHRDLKPSNILLVVLSSKKVLVKIADFGISAQINQDRTSKTISAVGSAGWNAPEVLKFIDQQKLKATANPPEIDTSIKMKKSADIFSLGCVFYFVISRGSHPFGETDTEYNIKHNLDVIGQNSKNFDIARRNQHLLYRMISQSPEERPLNCDILGDPIFWSYEKKLQFLIAISDFTEDVFIEKRKPYTQQDSIRRETDLFKTKEQCIENLEERYKQEICKGSNGWFGKIENDDLRQYLMWDQLRNRFTVFGLIRVIRNLSNHYSSLNRDYQDLLGALPNTYMENWLKIFPHLVYHTRCAFACLRSEGKLFNYYNHCH